MGLGAAIKGLGKGLWASNTARSGIIGAAAGGVYGGVSNDWSVWSGAAAGGAFGLAHSGRNRFFQTMAARGQAMSGINKATGSTLGIDFKSELAGAPGYTGSMIGGLVGGTYGLFSDDTSVLGGAAMGSAMGAGIGKFGVSPFMKRQASGGFGKAFKSEAVHAFEGAKLKANNAGNRIKGLKDKFKTDLAL